MASSGARSACSELLMPRLAAVARQKKKEAAPIWVYAPLSFMSERRFDIEYVTR